MQEHREGPLQDLDAGDAERAAVGAAAALRGARVLRTARQGGRRGLTGRQVRQRGHWHCQRCFVLWISATGMKITSKSV